MDKQQKEEKLDNKKLAEEYLNNWKRERADFLNYKKDESKRVSEIIKFANASLVLEIINVLDDLEIAAAKFPENNDEDVNKWKEGYDAALKKMETVLKEQGVERIKVKGMPFDPLLHEAISTEKDGQKIEEVRAGYTMHGKIIRPARVRIIK